MVVRAQVRPAVHCVSWTHQTTFFMYRRDKQHCWEVGYPIWWWLVSRKLRVSGHMLYIIIDLFSNNESHYGELVREFRFILCVRACMFVCVYIYIYNCNRNKESNEAGTVFAQTLKMGYDFHNMDTKCLSVERSASGKVIWRRTDLSHAISQHTSCALQCFLSCPLTNSLD